MRACLALLCASALLAACSSSGDLGSVVADRPDSGDTALSACYEQCGTRAEATKCTPGGTDLTECKNGCDALVKHLAPGCPSKARTAYLCGARATWACSVNGAPTIQDGGCQKENAAYAPCFAAK